jgi:hypothetical protein
MTGASSLDTVILIANKTPLTREDRELIKGQLAKLKGTKSTTPYEVFEMDYTGGKLDPKAGWSVKRGLGAAQAIDKAFDEVIRPIAERVDVLKAIRFSHWGGEGPPPDPK